MTTENKSFTECRSVASRKPFIIIFKSLWRHFFNIFFSLHGNNHVEDTVSVAGGDRGSPSPPSPESHLHGDTYLTFM